MTVKFLCPDGYDRNDRKLLNIHFVLQNMINEKITAENHV
jgi:hypothetical protein